jgi:predicted nucleotidyltransferase
LREREKEKVLQGLFHGYEFFVRIVKLPEEIKEVYGDVTCRHLGEIETVCHIVGDCDSIFTPAEYDVRSESMSGFVKIVSYRGRFAEHAHRGETVRIRGRLEEVTDVSTGEKHQQVVLGEKPSDYMVPA